jgi:hypothetical protein
VSGSGQRRHWRPPAAAPNLRQTSVVRQAPAAGMRLLMRWQKTYLLPQASLPPERWAWPHQSLQQQSSRVSRRHRTTWRALMSIIRTCCSHNAPTLNENWALRCLQGETDSGC